MTCSEAIKLIQEMGRTSEDTIPAYDTDTVRMVLNEMKSSYEEYVDIMNTSADHDEASLLSMKIRRKSIERNKRCLLAYHWNRLKRIRELRWQMGSILPPEIKSNLSTAEEQYYNSYGKSLYKYMKTIGPGDGLNLFENLTPPKSLYVQVRCLSDVGEMELDDGESVVFKRDLQYTLRRSQCETLIHQGILEQVD